MPSVIVVGSQWGDEGKGKIIDILSSHAKHVVRAQGGNNAGHTIVVGTDEYKLHLIPSGILHPDIFCYISAGTVLDPEVLIQEIKGLEARGHSIKGRLWISPAAHLIFPYHKRIDLLLEKHKGERSIGTTGRGIGPCYADKANRLGIRMGEFIRQDIFPRVLKSVLKIKNEELQKLYDEEPIHYETLLQKFSALAEFIRPYVGNVEEIIDDAMLKEENILFEGAQGTFLDINSGTYPFVTSSSTIAGGICVGAGVGPSRITHTLGVVKAYTTRVGHGPFPTEVKEDETFLDHQQAREFGTTTGRRRRIGWFDGILAKTAVRLNGLQSMAVTKLDILDSIDIIKICVGYKIDNRVVHYFPALTEDLEKAVPEYIEHPGWKCSTKNARSYDDLPGQAKEYLKKIEAISGVPISIISLGPERERTLMLQDPFAFQGLGS